MRAVIISLFFLSLSPALHAQPISRTEQRLVTYLNKIQQWEQHSPTYNEDSIVAINNDMLRYVLQDAPRSKGIMDMPFKTAQDHGLLVSTSADKRMRIFSWDTWQGGTMHIYSSILLYSTATGIKAFQLDQPDTSGNGEDPGYYYTAIETVTSNTGDNIYLLLGTGRYSTKDRGLVVKAVSVANNRLNDTLSLFVAGKRRFNYISCNYDLFASTARMTVNESNTIHFSPDKRTLFFPVVVGDIMTKRSLTYRFDGQHFVFDKAGN